jgi:aspartate/methionine/tyrosine aminotransferase
MKLQQFEMERFQSTWEPVVSYNLADSGIDPISVRDLAGDQWILDVLTHKPLGYGHTNGSPELLAVIANLHAGASPDHVLVTTGTAEANFLVTWALSEPGDDVVVMMPNYMQVPLLARSLGARVHGWWLQEGMRWAPDPDALQRLVSDRTKAIFVCNPNNPTGAILDPEVMSTVCAVADRVGSWIVADEVYRGAEVDGPQTPSFWGHYPRVVVTGGLSKAYGLPGARIGWVLAPPDLLETLWGYHDYTTIAPNMLGDHLARVALAPDVRRRLRSRTQAILSENLSSIQEWIASLEGRVSAILPEGGAIVFIRYQARINSTVFATRLQEEHSVLVVPGDHFEMDGYFRIGCGGQASIIAEGLRRTGTLLHAM